MSEKTRVLTAAHPLMCDYSLEMTASDHDDLAVAAASLEPPARVNVTFLASERKPQRLAAAQAVLENGLTPVPHIAARRLRDDVEFRGYLRGLHSIGASRQLFLVGGDPAAPIGPYASARELMHGDVLAEHGVQQVSVAGYPEGHPDIEQATLWRELVAKIEMLDAQGIESSIITQFGFDERPILEWIERVRGAGITGTIRIGVPGPAGVKRLLGFARRFGIASSAGVVKKYGFSLGNLVGTAGPDTLISRLEQGYDPQRHGDVGLHFYTFGGLSATAAWVRGFASR